MLRKTNFDKIEEIDAERLDPKKPEAMGLSVTRGCPVTVGNLRYPETCVVDVDRGQWPEWLKPHLWSIRRLQTRNDPPYGFVTETFSSFALTALVASDPGDATYLYDRLLKDARKAGWYIDEAPNGKRFDAYAPPMDTAWA